MHLAVIVECHTDADVKHAQRSSGKHQLITSDVSFLNDLFLMRGRVGVAGCFCAATKTSGIVFM